MQGARQTVPVPFESQIPLWHSSGCDVEQGEPTGLGEMQTLGDVWQMSPDAHGCSKPHVAPTWPSPTQDRDPKSQ